MFDYIEGNLVDVEPDFAVLHVGGWGVKLLISLSTYEKLRGRLNKQTRLYTHLALKDDYMELIGFEETGEREAFIRLNRVSGIGTKVGLAVLSFFDVARLRACILAEDAKTLMKVPGIGKKTAQRMILELKDKVKDLPVDGPDHFQRYDVVEAEEVLTSLGFSLNEVQRAIRSLPEDQVSGDIENLVKNALKKLSK